MFPGWAPYDLPDILLFKKQSILPYSYELPGSWVCTCVHRQTLHNPFIVITGRLGSRYSTRWHTCGLSFGFRKLVCLSVCLSDEDHSTATYGQTSFETATPMPHASGRKPSRRRSSWCANHISSGALCVELSELTSSQGVFKNSRVGSQERVLRQQG